MLSALVEDKVLAEADDEEDAEGGAMLNRSSLSKEVASARHERNGRQEPALGVKNELRSLSRSSALIGNFHPPKLGGCPRQKGDTVCLTVKPPAIVKLF